MTSGVSCLARQAATEGKLYIIDVWALSAYYLEYVDAAKGNRWRKVAVETQIVQHKAVIELSATVSDYYVTLYPKPAISRPSWSNSNLELVQQTYPHQS